MTTYNYKLVNFEEEIMQKYGVNELRRMFLEFFESKEPSGNEKLFPGASQRQKSVVD